jgi:hypothetical protein
VKLLKDQSEESGRKRAPAKTERNLVNADMASQDELHAKSQQTLIDFLRVELKLGSTFADSARIARAAGHMNRYAQDKHNAIGAAEAIRRSLSRVEDITIRTEIGEQLAEFDRLLSVL